MMLLHLLRSRRRRTFFAVFGLLVVLVFVGAAGIVAGGRAASARPALFAVVGLSVVGAGLAYAAARSARELDRLHAGRAESAEELARSEERLRLLAENAGDVIYRYRFSPTRGFEYVSPAATAVTGYTPEEHYADPNLGFKMAHPEDRHLLEESVEHPEAPLVLRWRRKDGRIVWTEQRNKPVYDASGELVAIEGIARDITAAKRGEEALREGEERLRLALDAASLGLWYQDLETDGFFASPQAGAMHGLPPGAPLDRETALAVVHPEDRERVAALVEGTIATGGSYEAEYRIVWPDGTVRWMASRARVYREDGGGRLIGVVQDITRRKEAERSLLLQAQLLDQVQAAVIATDTDGGVIHWNKHAERLYGWTREEALGRNVLDLTVGPDEAGVAEEIMARLRSGLSWEGEFTTRRKDGSRFPAYVSDALVYDEAGRPAGVVGVSVDLTSRKEAEEELRESEERFRAAFGSAALGMALVSPEGRWLQVNRALCEITGHSEEELLGTDFQSITHPEDLQGDLDGMRRLLAGETRYHYSEKRYVHRSGRSVWVFLSASLVRDAGGRPLYFVVQVQDITQGKRDKENLERLSLQNALILASAGEGIYGLDLRERTTFVNPAAEEMLGYEAGELIGRHQHDIIHHSRPDGTPYPPEDCPIYAALRDGGVHASSDEVFWRKDGTSFPVEYVSTPIRQNGAVIGAVVTFSDITERKRAEEAVRDSEERFRLLAENTSDLVCLHEPDGRYLYLSPSCRRLLGYDPAELIGTDPYDLFHPDDARRIRTESHDRVLEGPCPASITFRIRKESGEYAWFETLTEPILDDNGDVVRLQTASRDVTDRKRVEDALHESEERLRMAVRVSPVVLFRQDRDLRYTWIHNPQLGFAAENTLGKTDLDLLPPEDAERLTEIKRRVLETGTGTREEVRTTTGDAFYYDLTVEPLRDSAGDVVGLSGAAVDITGRKHVEQAVAEAARAKTDFLAEVSHELRTPLTVIRGNAEVGLDLRRGCVHDEVLEEIVQEAATMSRMVEDLLFLARSDSSTPIFRPQTVPAEAFLAALARRAALVAQERGAALEADLSGGGQLRIDPVRVEQAVLALVDNAAKYGRERVTLTSSTENGELCITVADDGPGIPEEHLPRVFDRFYRVDHAHQQSGAGLGLSIAATIAETHGGRIEAENRPGEGTRMSLHLPLAEPHPDGEVRQPLAGETSE